MIDLDFSELAAWADHVTDYLEHYDGHDVLESLRQPLAESVAANFQGAHDPSGLPWLPVKRRVPPPPLIVTRNLMLSAIEAAWHSVTADNALSIDTTLLPFYWEYQQYGTGTIPARPFLGFSQEFYDLASDLMAQDVAEKMVKI